MASGFPCCQLFVHCRGNIRYSVLLPNPHHDRPCDVDDYVFLSIQRRYKVIGGLALVAVGVRHGAATLLTPTDQGDAVKGRCMAEGVQRRAGRTAVWAIARRAEFAAALRTEESRIFHDGS
jgi:hypothetical protein